MIEISKVELTEGRECNGILVDEEGVGGWSAVTKAASTSNCGNGVIDWMASRHEYGVKKKQQCEKMCLHFFGVCWGIVSRNGFKIQEWKYDIGCLLGLTKVSQTLPKIFTESCRSPTSHK